MQSNYIQSSIKAKELLNELLKKHLENNLFNLELNNQREISTLSSIKNTSNELINYLSKFSGNYINDKKQIIIPKLKIDININKNKTDIKNGVRDHLSLETDSILKNKRYNKKNKEELSSTILSEKNNNKPKVSFIKNPIKNNFNLNITPDINNKHKSFINNFTTSKKGKNYIKRALTKNILVTDVNHKKKKKSQKSSKCLTERNEKDKISNKFPFITKEKYKKIFKNKNNILFHSDNKSNKGIIDKKEYKTSLNFYPKKNNNLLNNFVNEVELDKSNDKKKDKINVKEKNLNNLCDSILIDVNKDELLVNDSKISLNVNFDNELLLRKMPSSNNEDNKNKTKKNSYEKLKLYISYILKYLKLQDILNLYQTNKEILNLIINIQIKDTQKTIDEINSILISKNINIINMNDVSFVKDIKPFELNNNSIKALSLLNSISKTNFIKSIMNYKNQSKENKNINKIILIFDLYFIALGKKKILNSLNNNKKLEYIANYFKNNKNKLIGTIIENDLKGKQFDNYIIDSLYEYSYKYINIINPNYYKKINKDIAILVFLIKNILDYVGISYIDSKSFNNNKNNEQKIILINRSRLTTKSILLQKYNHILNKFKIE